MGIRNIECLERIIDKNSSYNEMIEWLILNKFTDRISADQPYNNRQKAEFIYEVLKKKEGEELIILLYFEWVLLPKESIKITCVTPTEEKIFTYGI